MKLLSALDFEVPQQDLSVWLNRFPALPESGFIILPRSESRN